MEGMKIVKQLVEVVTIEGAMSNRHEAIEWVYTNGYSTRRCGPKPTPNGKRSFDMDTYQVVAEKVVGENE